MAATRKMKSERGGKVSKASNVVRAPLPVRITPDLLDRIDDVRPDLIPREPFVRHLIELGLDQLEAEG